MPYCSLKSLQNCQIENEATRGYRISKRIWEANIAIIKAYNNQGQLTDATQIEFLFQRKFSRKVDAAFLGVPSLEDAAQGNLLAIASIRIVLSTAAKSRAASIVPNVTILPKTTVGNAPTRARTETSRRRSVDAAAPHVAVLTVAAVRDAASLITAAASKASAASV